MRERRALRVLLIEDNELDARTMSRSLHANSEVLFEVTRTEDLASAVTAIRTSEFDCMLLDLSLPDSVGLVSVEALTAEAPDCPIVVLTGLDDPTTALEAVEQGAQDYLSKRTADSDTVARSIRYAVARNNAETALRSATDQLGLLRDRERIARDLHDTVIQQLFATGIGLQSAAAAITDADVRDRVLGAVDGLDGAIRQLREAIFGLSAVPPTIALSEAIEDLVEEQVAALGFRPLVEVSPFSDEVPSEVRHEAIQVISEGLANMAKHAEATAASVAVTADDGQLVVTVTDNGRGIAHTPIDLIGDADGPGARPLTGRGLINMRDRAAGLDGQFHVGPGPGGGTRLEWRVPLDA